MCIRLNVHIYRFGILVLWLLYINSVDCVYWTQGLHQNVTRFRRQALCRRDQFTCNDGTCIQSDQECDGKDDCKDGSDETSDCKDVFCNPLFGFKCAYGACVGKNAECNGVKDCKDNSDEHCKNVTRRPTVNTPCSSATSFACGSGECISNEQLCDGRANCKDNSDETQEECSGLNCINAFRCKYGACVDQSAKCDGIKNCFDGSDEQGCPTPKPKPVTPKQTPATPKPTPATPIPKPPPDGGCVVPQVPTNGVFLNSGGQSDTFKQGDYVPSLHALITKCDRNYKTTPPNENFPICLFGKWNSNPLQCARHCTSLISSKRTKYTCKLNNIPLKSCADPVEGTIASIQCEYLYEGDFGYTTRLCRDGSWDYPIGECRPKCGVKSPKGVTNIVNGRDAVKGDYPWHVGIYANDGPKTHLCGGSIINQIVIISAAHCFTNNEGKLLSKENYLIAAGKYYRPYADARDQDTAQYSTIKVIYIPDRYRGPIGVYEADIAMVILSKALEISIAVQPVCVDWGDEFEYQQLSENNKGIVVGWGYTKVGDAPSIELKELETPYISYEQCNEEVPKDFRPFLTYDKVCAGFLNNGTSVCQGDSGGGLTFPRRSNDRYYIRGVVSTSPRSEDSCDPDQYATYTLISKHLQFIKDIEIVNRII